MASCQNQVGVLNLTLGFTNCGSSGIATGSSDISPRTHQMAKDQFPMYIMVPYTLSGTTNGRVKRSYDNAKVKIDISRDLAIPLSYYQGAAAIDFQCEHLSGAVVTGVSGFVTGVTESDADTVSMTIEFALLEELLPAGAITQG